MFICRHIVETIPRLLQFLQWPFYRASVASPAVEGSFFSPCSRSAWPSWPSFLLCCHYYMASEHTLYTHTPRILINLSLKWRKSRLKIVSGPRYFNMKWISRLKAHGTVTGMSLANVKGSTYQSLFKYLGTCKMKKIFILAHTDANGKEQSKISNADSNLVSKSLYDIHTFILS